MKDIFYSPLVSLILNTTMFYILWVYWSIPVVIIWILFIVFYNDMRSNWRKFKKNQKPL